MAGKVIDFEAFLHRYYLFSLLKVLASIAELPLPIREYKENIVLLGLWHSPKSPPVAILLGTIIDNLRKLQINGFNIQFEGGKLKFIGLLKTLIIKTYINCYSMIFIRVPAIDCSTVGKYYRLKRNSHHSFAYNSFMIQ